MTDSELSLVVILVALLQALTIAAPWPAALLVADSALARGRRAGLGAAAGVLAGSALWAAIGLSGLAGPVIAGPGLVALRLLDLGLLLALAGLLLALAGLSLRPALGQAAGRRGPDWAYGAALHALNPAVALFWTLTAAAFLGPGSGGVVRGLAITAAVHGAVALVCGWGPLRAGFTRHRRGVQGGLALFYALAAAVQVAALAA